MARRTRSGDEQHCHCEHRQCVGGSGGGRSKSNFCCDLRAANGCGEVVSWCDGVTFGDSRSCGCGCGQVAVLFRVVLNFLTEHEGWLLALWTLDLDNTRRDGWLRPVLGK
eukprot:3133831-Amphidinium_carterae.1